MHRAENSARTSADLNWDCLLLVKNLSALLILGSALALSAGCGRKGQLDTPYQAAVDARKEAQRLKQTPLPPEPEKPVLDKPFILDPLL